MKKTGLELLLLAIIFSIFSSMAYAENLQCLADQQFKVENGSYIDAKPDFMLQIPFGCVTNEKELVEVTVCKYAEPLKFLAKFNGIQMKLPPITPLQKIICSHLGMKQAPPSMMNRDLL